MEFIWFKFCQEILSFIQLEPLVQLLPMFFYTDLISISTDSYNTMVLSLLFFSFPFLNDLSFVAFMKC